MVTRLTQVSPLTRRSPDEVSALSRGTRLDRLCRTMRCKDCGNLSLPACCKSLTLLLLFAWEALSREWFN